MAHEVIEGGSLSRLLSEVEKFWDNETALPPVTIAAMAAILMAHGHSVSMARTSAGAKASGILNDAARIKRKDDSMVAVN